MKKILSLLLVLTLVFALSACGNEKNTTSEPDTSTTQTEIESTDNTQTTDSNTTEEISSDTETPSSSNPTSTPTTIKPTTTSKPSNTVSKDENTTNKNDTSTTNTPTVEPTEEKPYYIGYELISIERPNTTYKVNGVPLLEKAYGTKYVLQVGDTAILKIKMSDNGTNGFDVEYSGGCEAKIEGNLLKITATGGREKTDVYIRVDTKEGQKNIQISEFVINASSHNMTTTSLSMTELFEIYAMRKGLSCAMEGHYAFSGFFTKIESDVLIKIQNNSNWIEDAFNSIDTWVNAGYKKFTLQVVLEDCFEGSGGY